MVWTAVVFRHPRKKKDGTFQIKVKIRNKGLKFQHDFPIEYTYKNVKKKFCLSLNDWNSLSKNNSRIIHVAEHKYKEILKFLKSNNRSITAKSISELYSKHTLDLTNEIDTEKIRHLLSYDLPLEMIDDYSDSHLLKLAKELDELAVDNQDLQEDEVGTILLQAEEQMRIKTDMERSKLIDDCLLRCDAQYKIVGYFDMTRIIDVFGSYWTLKRINDSRFLTKYDSKIILRIAQFIFLTGASNKISDLNYEWIKSYFLHLRNYGYLDTRLVRNYTPLELYDYKNVIISNKHKNKIYSVESYIDQIKKFKKYYSVLSKKTSYLDSLEKLDIDDFDIKSLRLSDADYDQEKTQKEHYVNVEELELMNNYVSENENLNLSRDLFFIQTFSGGSRSIDKDIVTSKNIKGITYFEVHHSKTKSKNISGVSKYLDNVLKRHEGKLPRIKVTAKEYNYNLKEIAKELNLNRSIEFVRNKVNSKITTYEYKPLYECISQYFSRHTIVNYLVDGGTSDDDIIKITGHATAKILEHYKKNITLIERQKIIDMADKNNKVV